MAQQTLVREVMEVRAQARAGEQKPVGVKCSINSGPGGYPRGNTGGARPWSGDRDSGGELMLWLHLQGKS